jgi:hypothetical protein
LFFKHVRQPADLEDPGGRSITRKKTRRRASYKFTFVTREAETDVQVARDEYLLSAADRVDQSEAFRVFPDDEAAGYVLGRGASQHLSW